MQQLIGFDDLQQQLLQLFWQQKLPHAIMLSGPKGIGKATFAQQFASLIDSETKIISKDNNKTAITVDQIRQTNDFFYQNSIAKNCKVLIIDSACTLNKSASNALLKPLEEPIANTFLLLIAHNLAKVLPTILSRCQIFKIPLLTQQQFYLAINNGDFSDQDIEFLSKICNNCPALAIQLGKKLLEFYKMFLESLQQNNLNNKLYQISQHKDFDFLIFELIMQHFFNQWLKYKVKLNNISYFFNEYVVFDGLLFDISQIIDLQDFLNQRIRDIKIFHLDKKLAIINIFNRIIYV
jgi:DNA polymerase-3 subunit delta'